MRSLQKGT
ncbi:hypothetical protein BpHYR1_050990 [Brachionus plicatilis]|uniref:Uncharacterized protein n=1 Tax=Brachionus plicatilis TaxID=10195 RepID=A0A3M7PGP2_BRAPC|nr:hypothetical protein BpHYR1_050990 [Brachionus plicatilis]